MDTNEHEIKKGGRFKNGKFKVTHFLLLTLKSGTGTGTGTEKTVSQI